MRRLIAALLLATLPSLALAQTLSPGDRANPAVRRVNAPRTVGTTLIRPFETAHDLFFASSGSIFNGFTVSEHGTWLVQADLPVSGFPLRTVVFAPTIRNDAVRTSMGGATGLEFAPQYTTQGFAGTVTQVAAVWSTPFIGGTLLPNNSTMVAAKVYDIYSTPSVNAGTGTATIQNRYGHYFGDLAAGSTGTQQTVDAFYVENQTASSTVRALTSLIVSGANNLALNLSGGADNLLGTGVTYGGSSSSNDLSFAANPNYGASWAQANTGRIKFRERLTFPDSWSPAAIIVNSTDSLITATATYTLPVIGTVSSGGAANQFSGFLFAPTINYSTRQVVAIIPAFWAKPTFAPTANTGDVLSFFSGFWSEPVYAPTVTGASTNLLSGYISTPKATVATGTATITNVDGFTAFPGSSNTTTIGAGVTANLVSGYRVSNLLGVAGTATTFAGVEIEALTLGSTTIGVHSGITANASRYFLKDDGGAQSFLTGKFTTYNAVTTKGFGLTTIVAAARSPAATAAVASVASFTPAADGTFRVSANVLVTTATNHSFTVTCSYTDEGNTARITTLNFTTLAGVISNAAIANAGGAVPYAGVPLHIRAKGGTAITIGTTGTFTTVTYNVDGLIEQVS